MLRISFFVVAFIIIGGSEAKSVLNLSDYDVIHVVDNHNSCSRRDVERWANVFVTCFVNRKNLWKTKRDVFNIVDRLLDRSKYCIKFATLECRPNYDGFLNIMGKVIEMIKEYCNMHVERLTRAGIIAYPERADKILDLNCVENSLTKDTYATCFSSIISAHEKLGENETYDLIYQKEVEMAILCTNTAKRQCSKSFKIDLNKVVRYILGVKQPEKEDFEDDRMPTKLPRHTEPPKPQLELRKTEKGNIDDVSIIFKLRDSTSHAESAEFPEAEKEKLESNFENTKLSESHDFREGKNDDDEEFHDYTKYFTFTETFILNEQTTILDLAKSENENIKNDPKIPEDLEDIEDSAHLHPNGADLVHMIHFTELPVAFLNWLFGVTDAPKSKHLTNSTGLDASKDHVVADAADDTMTEPATTGFEEEFTASTKLPKIIELPKTIESTKPPNSVNISISTTSTKFTTSTEHSKTTTSAKPPKFTELQGTTTSTIPPKTTERPRTTTSTKPPRPIERSSTSASTKHPEPTKRRRISTSTKPLKSTERSSTTTTTRPSTSSSSAVRFRSWNDTPRRSRSWDDTPRPTEAPRPWYDFIVRPFVSLWTTVKSWFGW